MNVRAALAEGSGALEGARSGTPFLDAALLLGHALGLSRSRLLASMPDELPLEALEAFRSYISRRVSGEPVAYIVGGKEFYGRPFIVDQRVLVPRPETELLVELALERLPPAAASAPRCHDAFCGSGCVGLTIAAERPAAIVGLSDLSEDALAVCAANARALLDPGRTVSIERGDVLSAAVAPLDIVTANPPYVSTGFVDGLKAEGNPEPRLALDGGDRGLDPYPSIARQAFALLRPGAWLLLEIGEEQGAALRGILEAEGYVDILVHRDLAGLDRVVTGRRP